MSSLDLSKNLKNNFIIKALENGWSIKKLNNNKFEFSMDINNHINHINKENKTKIRSKSSPITNKDLIQYIFNYHDDYISS